jgi:Tfp pilus assembly protein PilZ
MRPRRRSLPNASTWIRREQAATAVMVKAKQQRNALRMFVRLPAWVTLETRSDEHVAFVRDISPRGIFFYSDFVPKQGDEINFVLEYLSGKNKTRLHLHGKVVRLEKQAEKTMGIAVEFDAPHEEVPRSPNAFKGKRIGRPLRSSRPEIPLWT